ncbi:MAG: methyltransferase domain-containing protein [Dermatophilaceae bacterium]
MGEPSVIERVAAAFEACPRARHLPPAQAAFADVDQALPIGYGQTNSQPRTVRAMLVALDPRPGHRVLDVGSGSGWTTVLLAHLVGPTGRVIGVERVPELVAMGRDAVAAAGMPWASVEAADPDVLGAPVEAPFDRILVSAMATGIPAPLREQLGPGGVLVVPADGVLWRVTADGQRPLGRYVFVPLVQG